MSKDQYALGNYEKKCAEGTVTTEQFKSLMDGASAEAQAYAVQTQGAAGSTQAFVAKQRQAQSQLRATAAASKTASIAAKAFSVALNMAAFALISKGIEFVVGLIDNVIHATEKAMVSLDEASQTFSNTTSELESLNNELQTTADKIKELEKLKEAGTISIAQEDELQTLKEQNKELERQIVLKKQEQIESAKNVLKSLDNVDLNVTSKYDTLSLRGTELGKVVTREEEADNAQEKYNELLKQKTILEEQESELLKKQENGDFTAGDAYVSSNYGQSSETVESDQTRLNNIQKQIEDLDAELKKTDDYIGDLYNENVQKKISAYESLIDEGVELNAAQQEDYDSLKSLEDAYLMHCYRVQQTEEAYRALNIEQQKSVLLDKLKEKGYTDEQAQSIVASMKEDNLDNYYTADFDFNLPDLNDYDGDLEKWAKDFAAIWANHVNKYISGDSSNSILSFIEAFNSQSFSEAKEKLLELSTAGELSGIYHRPARQ